MKAKSGKSGYPVGTLITVTTTQYKFIGGMNGMVLEELPGYCTGYAVFRIALVLAGFDKAFFERIHKSNIVLLRADDIERRKS